MLNTFTSESHVGDEGLAPRPRSFNGAVALGLGMMLPAVSQAVVLPSPCTFGVTLANGGRCSLDVNGGGADLVVYADANAGYLQSISGGLGFLVSPQSGGGKGALLKLAAGASVDASMFDGDPGTAANIGYAYGFGNPWSIGQTGFAGFRISTAGGYNYGWIELTRGSLTVNSFGYQSTLNGAAVIPGGASTGIPEPASLLLVATGFAGIAALRRRRCSARSQLAH